MYVCMRMYIAFSRFLVDYLVKINEMHVLHKAAPCHASQLSIDYCENHDPVFFSLFRREFSIDINEILDVHRILACLFK